MTRHTPSSRPAEGAAPFDVEEMFFSRTDPRGVIQSGNQVFRRVAHYEWSELVGAPHKRIRHPDMPRGVFQLFWDRLQDGKMVAAYVKNRAKDGLHYWVFALAVPVEGGYISVRITPKSEIFETVQAEYGALLAREADEGLSPADSAQALLARLDALGFPSYDAFMAEAIRLELAARDDALGRPEKADWKRMTSLSDLVSELRREAAALATQFEGVRSIPVNLGIAAVALGDEGRPISVIAENYALMCREIFAKLGTLTCQETNGFGQMADQTRRAQILSGAAQIQSEMVAVFGDEEDDGRFDHAAEAALLNNVCDEMRRATATALEAIRGTVVDLKMTFVDLERLVAGLDVTRILCRVEGGRLPPARATALIGIIESLDIFHSKLSERLEALNRITVQITETGDALAPRNTRPPKRAA